MDKLLIECVANEELRDKVFSLVMTVLTCFILMNFWFITVQKYHTKYEQAVLLVENGY
jgi:hypothetical protein